ncbi:MAG: 3-deoxy-manno-octulosonate cytidylyltransferase [Lentisphaerae bacterium]|nr:MAG: 3-deoxy-manno-octulosonate cytidylyltransferase [Lentisphaerota bacterium]
MKERVIAVIPARYGSTRFPGKALYPLLGKPMILHTLERVRNCQVLDDVLVATDDERIARVVREAGGKAVMTSPHHPSGTDRIAEAIQECPGDLIINVQGDEPLVPADALIALIQAMEKDSDASMGTIAVPMEENDPRVTSPSVVKIALSQAGYALYFSRAPIPFARDERPPQTPYLQHVGIYAYRRSFLQHFVSLPPSPLERCECLEQLRALEAGARIRVVISSAAFVGVDEPADVQRVEALLKELKK